MSFLVNISGPCPLIEYLYPLLEKKISRITCHNFQGRDLATIGIELNGPTGLVDFKLLQLEDYIEKLLRDNPFPSDLKIEVSNRLSAEPLGIAEYFQESFCPVPNLTIVPWLSSDPVVPEAKTIYLDPGAAFGSGQHSSTRLSLSLLEEGIRHNSSEEKKINLLDVGCGSGILGIAAVIFGADRVVGIETDPDAVDTARKNVLVNGLADRITIESGSLETVEGNFDMIVANLVPSVANKLLPEMVTYLTVRGMLVMAGFQNGLLARVIEKLAGFGLTILETRQEKGWSAVTAKKRQNTPTATVQ